ncbi:hypothetical protein MHY87_12765 [Microvirga sp. ACRRW]|uniref:hypothetical protein n=1 Tax=Microvirga sp. ACRRW TaxID=2918205 RepID=UPI001EF40F4F|nr:hypothetical protein [Microvirga sp. ACRRW]MCG7393779.1 hypothetical protein [Microvirga sp. ACRRW]
MMMGRMLLRGIGICLGAILGVWLGLFIGEAIFFLFFGMSLYSAEGTMYEIYAIVFTFNGALFGLFLGGLGGLLLMRNSANPTKSQSNPPEHDNRS